MIALSKALGWPGFGYVPPKLKIQGKEVETTEQLQYIANEVERQVELLEWELRRDDRLR